MRILGVPGWDLPTWGASPSGRRSGREGVPLAREGERGGGQVQKYNMKGSGKQEGREGVNSGKEAKLPPENGRSQHVLCRASFL